MQKCALIFLAEGKSTYELGPNNNKTIGLAYLSAMHSDAKRTLLLHLASRQNFRISSAFAPAPPLFLFRGPKGHSCLVRWRSSELINYTCLFCNHAGTLLNEGPAAVDQISQ